MYKFVLSDSYDNCRYFKSKKELETALSADYVDGLEFDEISELSVYELGKQYQVVKNVKVILV